MSEKSSQLLNDSYQQMLKTLSVNDILLPPVRGVKMVSNCFQNVFTDNYL